MPADRQIVWRPTDGGAPLTLTDPARGVDVRWHLVGAMAPPYRLTTRRYPGQPGVRLEGIQADQRIVEVGLLISGDSRSTFLQTARSLVRRIRAGAGRLTVVEADGSLRWLECVYEEGLEGTELAGSGDDTWWKPVASFLAPSPYARSRELTEEWSLAPSGPGWFPIIPIVLGASGIGGRRTIFNPGDVESYPVVEVTGPGSGLVVRHRGTGRAAHLDYTIPAEGPAATVTIDTRPGEQAIVDGYGVNLFRYLTDDDPSLFPLLPGANDIEVLLAGTADSSRVRLSYEPLYESL